MFKGFESTTDIETNTKNYQFTENCYMTSNDQQKSDHSTNKFKSNFQSKKTQ